MHGGVPDHVVVGSSALVVVVTALDVVVVVVDLAGGLDGVDELHAAATTHSEATPATAIQRLVMSRTLLRYLPNLVLPAVTTEIGAIELSLAYVGGDHADPHRRREPSSGESIHQLPQIRLGHRHDQLVVLATADGLVKGRPLGYGNCRQGESDS